MEETPVVTKGDLINFFLGATAHLISPMIDLITKVQDPDIDMARWGVAAICTLSVSFLLYTQAHLSGRAN